METKPYAYDTTAQRIPRQNQLYEGRYASARTGQPRVLQNQRQQPATGNQKPRPPEKMPKARALALARTFKKWLAVASIVGFGTFSGLAAFHQIGSTTSSTSSNTTSSSSSSSQNSSSFLKQNGNNVGTSSSSQGSSSSTSSSSGSASQGAVSGTHTS